MDIDLVIGIIVGVLAVGLNIALVLWSRRTVERIAAGSSHTAREILRELRGGK